MIHLRGTGVSPGIAVGRALVMERDAAPVFRLAVPAERLDAEVRRLEGRVKVITSRVLDEDELAGARAVGLDTYLHHLGPDRQLPS